LKNRCRLYIELCGLSFQQTNGKRRRKEYNEGWMEEGIKGKEGGRKEGRSIDRLSKQYSRGPTEFDTEA
jgi:hypothetical protein